MWCEGRNFEANGARATVRFPLDEKLPITLIKKLVRARVRKNDEAKKRKY